MHPLVVVIAAAADREVVATGTAVEAGLEDETEIVVETEIAVAATVAVVAGKGDKSLNRLLQCGQR